MSIQILEQASRIAPDDALVSGNLRHVRDLKSQHADSRASGEMRAAHIVVANEDFAAVLLDQIRKGEDFATLARTHSIDPSRTSGGDIGAFRPGDLMPAFEQLVSRLTPGEVGGPLKTPLGYHLIKRIY